MKILHIHPSMQGGGIESMICGLANAMSASESVTVCSIFEPKDSDVFWNKLAADVHRVSLCKTSPGFSVKEIFKIFWHIARGGYDVVNIHGFFYYYALSVLLLHRRVKFFYTIHSDAIKENASWDRQFFAFKKFCFKHGWVKPITISAVSQQSFNDFYHCPSTLIYNGVPKPDVNEFDSVREWRITPDTVMMIHAGRIDTPKNQLVLCRAMKRVIEDGHDVVLLVAGSKQKEDIYAQIEPYFCNRIIYLGERNDIPQLMACCDAMCLPSIWEGMPVTLLESLSVGCVPICSPVGGIPNVIIHGENGLLSGSSSEEDYYAALTKFLNMSQEQRRNMKQKCRNSFKPFDIVNTAASYIKYYQQK